MHDLFLSAPRVLVPDDTSGDGQRSISTAAAWDPAHAGASSQSRGQNNPGLTPLPSGKPPVGFNSDPEGSPRLTAAEKGKGPAAAHSDEDMMDTPGRVGS